MSDALASSLCAIREEEPEDGVGVTLQSCAGSDLPSEASLTLILQPLDLLLSFPRRQVGWGGEGVG